jgi:hypothetical protein
MFGCCAVLQNGLPLPVDVPCNAEALFTMPVYWSFMQPLEDTCVNLPLGKRKPRQCKQGELQSGVQCKSTACGRPSDWPEDKPFYIPIDLLSPVTYDRYIAAVRAARELAGKPTKLTAAEKTHIRVRICSHSTPSLRLHTLLSHLSTSKGDQEGHALRACTARMLDAHVHPPLALCAPCFRDSPVRTL